jgi:hypothetical protein
VILSASLNGNIFRVHFLIKISKSTWSLHNLFCKQARVDLGMDPRPLTRKRSSRSKSSWKSSQTKSRSELASAESSHDLAALSAAAEEAASVAAAEGPTLQQTQDFKNHPTVRTYRNEYINWRRGALRAASSKLNKDQLSSVTVRVCYFLEE